MQLPRNQLKENLFLKDSKAIQMRMQKVKTIRHTISLYQDENTIAQQCRQLKQPVIVRTDTSLKNLQHVKTFLKLIIILN